VSKEIWRVLACTIRITGDSKTYGEAAESSRVYLENGL